MNILFPTTGGAGIPARCIPSGVRPFLVSLTAPRVSRLSIADCNDSFVGGSSKLEMKGPFGEQSMPRNKRDNNVWSRALRIISGSVSLLNLENVLLDSNL